MTDHDGDDGYRRLILPFLAEAHGPNFLQGVTVGIRSTLVPIFARELGANDATIGVILSIVGVSRLLMAVPSGFVTDRFGLRVSQATGMWINVIGSLVAYLATSGFTLGVASAVWAAGIAMFMVSRQMMLADLVDRKRRGRLMALLGGGARWASVAGPMLGGIVIQLAGCAVASLAIIPMAVGCAVLLLTSERVRTLDAKVWAEARASSAARAAARAGVAGATDQSWSALLREHGARLFIVGFFGMLVVALRSCRRMLLPLCAMNLGLSSAVVGATLSVSFAVDASLFFLGGLVMDKMGRRFAAIPTAANLGIGFLLLPFGSTPTRLMLVGVFFGFADSLGSGLLQTMNIDHVPKKGGAKLMGLMRMWFDAGELAGPAVAGLLTHYFSLDTACYALGGIGLFGGLWAYCLLPESSADGDESVPAVAVAADVEIGVAGDERRTEV